MIPVKAHPGARKNALLGERAGALRIAVFAPPEKGKANAAILEVLADALGCRTRQVRLLTGASSRSKTFLVQGLTRGAVRERLDQLLAADTLFPNPEP